jgi:hypothetical protein
MKNKLSAIVFLMYQCFAQAADIEVRPPVNGGFAIKSADGSVTRFKVEETGGVAVQNVLSGLNNQPLCWNPTTKYLEVCADAVGRDYIKPTISVELPIAWTPTSFINVTYEDNIELGSYTINRQGNNTTADENIRTKTIPIEIPVGLNSSSTIKLSVIDTSGNMTKRVITIPSQPVAIKAGTYNLASAVTYPSGFDCRRQIENLYSEIDGTSFSSFNFYLGNEWTINGYIPGISLLTSLRIATPVFETRVPFSSESISVNTYEQENNNVYSKISATFNITQTTPFQLSGTLAMQCKVGSGSWTSGPSVSFTGTLQ